MNAEEFLYVKKKIRDLTQFDLDHYGYNQMFRRLNGYILRYKVDNVAQFCKMLENDKNELQKLEKFLTINVSEFFRDLAQFKILQENILPEMLNTNLGLNIWSAGCSNGAEAYSIAILLDRHSPYRKHRILATDIDKKILSLALDGGPYKPEEIRNVPKALLKEYFINDDSNFWVSDSIRKKVTFKLHDLTRDPFENSFDLIVCRNVVIYFNKETQRELFSRYADYLADDGYLVIGHSESLHKVSNDFKLIGKTIYSKAV